MCWVCQGDWIPNQGYIQVFECARAFQSPTVTTYDVFSQAAAVYRCLESKPGLLTGVWNGNWAIVQVTKTGKLQQKAYTTVRRHTQPFVPVTAVDKLDCSEDNLGNLHDGLRDHGT